MHLRCKRVNFKVAPALVAPLTNGDAPELDWSPSSDDNMTATSNDHRIPTPRTGTAHWHRIPTPHTSTTHRHRTPTPHTDITHRHRTPAPHTNTAHRHRTSKPHTGTTHRHCTSTLHTGTAHQHRTSAPHNGTAPRHRTNAGIRYTRPILYPPAIPPHRPQNHTCHRQHPHLPGRTATCADTIRPVLTSARPNRRIRHQRHPGRSSVLQPYRLTSVPHPTRHRRHRPYTNRRRRITLPRRIYHSSPTSSSFVQTCAHASILCPPPIASTRAEYTIPRLLRLRPPLPPH